MNLQKLLPGWKKYMFEDKPFYYNEATKEKSWSAPVNGKPSTLLNDWFKKAHKDGKRFYYCNKKTGETQWDAPVAGEKPSDLSNDWVLWAHKDGIRFFYYNKKTGKTQWDAPEGMYIEEDDGKGNKDEGHRCDNIRGLNFTGNSCYLDSTLVSLFAVPTAFANNLINMDLSTAGVSLSHCGETKADDIKNRQIIQAQLKLIMESIRGSGFFVKNCINLRKTLKACPDSEDYFDENIKDAGEFLGYILRMFPVNIAQKRVVTYGTKNMDLVNPPMTDLVLTSVKIDSNASVVQFVNEFTLASMGSGNHNISSFLSSVEDSYPYELSQKNLFKANGKSFERRIATETLEYTPYLIFNLKRISQGGFIKTKIIPEKKITLSNGRQQFDLSAVVVFANLHYTSFFRCDEGWFYFDDSPNGTKYVLREVGSYAKMLKCKPSPLSQGTLYFYTPAGVVLPPPEVSESPSM